MVTEACQHASGRAFRLSTRLIKKRLLLHCDVSRLRSYDGRALYAHADTVHRADCHSPSLWHKPDPGPPTAGIPKYLPASDLNQDSTWTQPGLNLGRSLGTPPGHYTNLGTNRDQDRGQGATRWDSNRRRAAKSGALCSRYLGIRQPGRKRLAEVQSFPRTVQACDWPEGPSCETVPSGPEIAHRKPCWVTSTSLSVPAPAPAPAPASLPHCLTASLPHCLTASLLSRRQEGQPQAPAPRPRTRVLRIGARTGR